MDTLSGCFHWASRTLPVQKSLRVDSCLGHWDCPQMWQCPPPLVPRRRDPRLNTMSGLAPLKFHHLSLPSLSTYCVPRIGQVGSIGGSPAKAPAEAPPPFCSGGDEGQEPQGDSGEPKSPVQTCPTPPAPALSPRACAFKSPKAQTRAGREKLA